MSGGGIDLTPARRPSRGELQNAAVGVVSEPFPYSNYGNATILTSQKLEGALIGLRAGDVITGVAVGVTTNSASLTLSRVALYSTAGALLASSASAPTALDAAAGSRARMAFSATYTVPADGAYYAAILQVGTTPATLTRGINNNTNDRMGDTSKVYPFVAQTGQADLPSTATFAQEILAFWIAVY